MSIEEKYDEVRQLISIGKEKGYLLYDEINELLPADITSAEELDDLFSAFGSAGIEVVDSEQKYREDKLLDRTGEGAEEVELDVPWSHQRVVHLIHERTTVLSETHHDDGTRVKLRAPAGVIEELRAALIP